MVERGIDVSYETIRRWVDKFGSTYAERITYQLNQLNLDARYRRRLLSILAGSHLIGIRCSKLEVPKPYPNLLINRLSMKGHDIT